MRLVAILLIFFASTSCVTTSWLPVHASAEGEAMIDRLRDIRCELSRDRIFRASLFEDDKLVFLADIETDVSSAIPGRSLGSLVLRAETMEEMLRITLNRDLDLVDGLPREFAGHPVSMDRTSVSVDQQRIPLGPGEFACLMEAAIPRHWLEAPRKVWNPAGKAIEFNDGNRQVSISRDHGGQLKVRIIWSSSWFSKSSIRVTMSSTAGPGTGVSGSMQAPGGYWIRWTEI
ncbi:MAG: hypothetical protein RIQ81_946 [Pseudomonadota bacterium]|jgi:hypothetical protein